MLASFLMSFIFVGGLSFVMWRLFCLLNGDVKEPWKNDKWFTVGEYRRLSTADKLKYHKHNGHIAEKLDLEYPLSTLVEIKYRDLETLYRIKKEDGKDFFLDQYTKLSLENQDYKQMGIKIICYKLNDGKTLELSVTDSFDFCVLIKIGRESAAFVSYYDNVIEWENLLYRDEILQAINKLDINLENKLVL